MKEAVLVDQICERTDGHILKSRIEQVNSAGGDC